MDDVQTSIKGRSAAARIDALLSKAQTEVSGFAYNRQPWEMTDVCDRYTDPPDELEKARRRVTYLS